MLEYPELGMEAVWQIEVRDFPAFIIVDDKGNDFFTGPAGGQADRARCSPSAAAEERSRLNAESTLVLRFAAIGTCICTVQHGRTGLKTVSDDTR